MSTTLSPTDLLRPLNRETLDALLAETGGPCVSIYMPTHRRGSQTRENPIRFKSLLQRATDELKKKYPSAAGRLNDDLLSMVDDTDFWRHQLSALAIFHGPGETRLIRLPQEAREHVAVAESFHIKPLIRIMQSPGRYQLLAITQKNVTLYEGDGESLDVVPLHPDVPRTLVEAIGGEVRGEVNASHYGGMSYSGMFHGHHDNKDDRDVDLERFFRVIDKAVYDYHCRGGDLPMYLAAVTDYHDRFQKASHHPRLQKQGVRINPEAVEVDTDRLRKEMLSILESAEEKRVGELLEQFGNALAARQGSDDLKEIAHAAAMGRVMTLLLNDNMRQGGRVDPVSGKITKADEHDPDVDDVFDDVAELTIKTGGSVRVLPPGKLSDGVGAAAIYRY